MKLAKDIQDERPATIDPQRPGRRGLLRVLLGIVAKIALAILALLLLLILGGFLVDTIGIGRIQGAQSFVDAIAFPLFLFRVCLYGLILYYWQPLTRWFARRQDWSEVELDNALARRNEMAIYLLLFELVVSTTFLVRLF